MSALTHGATLAGATVVVLVTLGYFTIRKRAETSRMSLWPVGGAILGGLFGLRATDLDAEQAWVLPALGSVMGLLTGGALWLVDGTRSSAAQREGGEPFLALTSFLLCWAPFFGVLLTGVSVFKNRGVRGWPRILSVIGLLGSVAITSR